jgi:hypothetical protein
MIPVKFFFIALLVTTCNFALANSLKGVKEISILIEPLDEDAKRCNITESFLEATVRVRLSNSNIKVVSMERMPFAFIYLNVDILEDQDFCIAAVTLSFNKYITTEKETGSFWNVTQLLSIRKINVQKRLSDSIDILTKQFLSAWLKANQN